MREHADVAVVTVEGHTDNVGVPARNKVLSKQRADAVKAWLISRGGVQPRRLLTAGWGQERPVTSNGNEAGRASNRRVEFHVVKGRGNEPANAPSGATAATH